MIREDHAWDRTRHLVAIIYNQNRGKRPYRKPSQLYPLTIDRLGRKGREWTKDKYQEFERAREAWGLKEPENKADV